MRLSVIYATVVFVMILWGFNVVAIKVIVEQFPAVTITSMRIFIASLVVWLILWTKKDSRLPTKKEAGLIFLAMLTGVVGHHYFLSVGLTKTTASNSGLILGTVPLTTSILAAVMLKEKLSFLRLSGLFIGLFGVSIIVLNGAGGLLSVNGGDVFIAFAVLTQALSFIFIKQTSETMKASLITGYILLIGSFFLFLISLVMEPGALPLLKNGSAVGWWAFLASGILATGVGHYLYNNAIPHIGPGRVSIFNNMTPFFALIGSSLFLNEHINLTQVSAFILIVVSVILGSGLGDRFILKRKYRRMDEDSG